MHTYTHMTRYSIQLSPDAWDDAHFELRYGDNERPLHLVFRRKAGRFGINSKREGVWGKELANHPFALTELVDNPVLVDLHPKFAFVRVGETCVTFPIATRDDAKASLSASTKNLKCSSWPMQAGCNVVMEDGGRITLQLLQRKFEIPEKSQPFLAALLLDGCTRSQPYINFLASRVFPTRISVIDMYRRSAWSALAYLTLIPSSRVYRVCANDAEREFISSLAQSHGLTERLTAISEDDVDALLVMADGSDILLQGEGVFERKREAIERLSPAQREHLHIQSHEQAIVPANVVLPPNVRRLSNIQVKVGQHWEINQHAAIATDVKLPGLDIVVAAYNVKDYIVECTRSLLCEGRKDVRVLVVNDGSTDDTEERVAKEFAGEDRVVILNKLNGGCASARNYGRLMSDRTHIAFVDGDDFVSANMFADLYDLAVYSGNEVVRASFNFHDSTRKDPYYPSYEDDLYAGTERRKFGTHDVIQLHSSTVIKGQPSVWRKVYRRDFLDTKNIWFPENIRAYDDFIFQMLVLTAAGDILMMPDHKYHYRQHPAQDIKQGDERHFFMPQMFRTLLRRSVDEGWPNFYPYSLAITDSMRWSASVLRPDLVDSFLKACAQFCVAVEKVHGEGAMPKELIDSIDHPDFAFHMRKARELMASVPGGHFWSYFSGSLEHPDSIRMIQNLHRKV